MVFGGEFFVQSTPGFVLGIRGNLPDSFSHTSIGLKQLLVCRSPAVQQAQMPRDAYVHVLSLRLSQISHGTCAVLIQLASCILPLLLLCRALQLQDHLNTVPVEPHCAVLT